MNNCGKLVPDNPVTVLTQLTLSLFLRLSQLRIPSLNLENRGFTNFVPKKIAFLNHKIAALTDFLTIVPLYRLVKRKTILSNITFNVPTGLREPSGSIAKTHGFSVD
jgi:hypothetical protein